MTNRLAVGAAVGLAVLAGAQSSSAQPALHGPGRHWIADVEAGTAMFESRATVGVDVTFDGQPDLTFDAAGPTRVVRSAALAVGASRRTHLDLEIFSMVLAGTIPTLGPFTLTVGDGVPNLSRDGPLYSAGTSDEVPDDPRVAADVFHLFFRIEVAGQILHNDVPFRVEAIIDRLPPIGSAFRLVGPPVPLLTDAGTPVLQITDTVNRVVRPPPRPCDAAGLDHAALAEARANVVARCACASGRRARPACVRRVVRARNRAGILNRRCTGLLRRCP